MLRPTISPGEYHLAELKIALDGSHPAHILPPPLPAGQKVLDLGCGAGQTLVAAYPDRIAFGLDMDFAALKLGGSLTDRVRFVCGTTDALPYRAEQFDLVVARVSLPYTNIPASLREIRRVLKPGGTLWMTLHGFSHVWNQAKRSGYRGKLVFAYVVLNSALLHVFGWEFPVLGRYESFQTDSGILRVLRRHNFDGISISHNGPHFLVTATAASPHAAEEEPAAMGAASGR